MDRVTPWAKRSGRPRLGDVALITATSNFLDQNLRALARGARAVAALVGAAEPRADLTFAETAEGVPTGVLQEWSPLGTAERALASRRRPLQEAQRLAEKVDVGASPAVVVVGFGMGYHVAELARAMKRTGVVIVFEPDVALLRSVLERVDHSDWLEQSNVLLLTDAEDEGAMAEALQGLEHVLAMGVAIVEHPASGPRLAGAGRVFLERFTGVLKAVRTTVVTSMVQTEATLRNLTQNLDHYALGRGIADLKDACAGRPAIVIAAGPSLQRNIDLLARPGVRDNFVLIAAQTVLKPLLARGIRPHFVTALDFHEISRRFYEGLTPADVRGVTLVVEPKVNPAVPASFPGDVRCTADGWLDELLGPALARPMGAIQPGATVAHLSYYLARFLGCDPVALVGQDLGFTDGQYYAAGAAIHDVWAPELNEFNTLEMHEWQRIVRHRPLLRRVSDHLGRPVYTDEQMATYLVQFLRDFRADQIRGLVTIDATEGGVAKPPAEPRTLEETIAFYGFSLAGTTIEQCLAAACASADAPCASAAPDPKPAGRRGALTARLASVARDVAQVAAASREARAMLVEMREHQSDQIRVNRLIDRVERLRDRVSRLEPAFSMVQRLNQTGAFNRARADRSIHVQDRLEGMDLQKAQIDRDVRNVEWLADAADALGAMLTDAQAALAGAPKQTRDPLETRAAAQARAATAATAVAAGPVDLRPTAPRRRVWAIVPWRDGASTLGLPAVDTTFAGRHPLALTLARLARTAGLDGIAVLAEDPDRARRAAGVDHEGRLRDGRTVRFLPARAGVHAWPDALLRGARLWAADCWRGGLGGLTIFDEIIEPAGMLAALEELGADAALAVAGDWCLVDPDLCAALVERHREDPAANRVAFTQAAPGLAGCVVDRAALADFRAGRVTAGTYASFGGMLAYVPVVPLADPIARQVCVPVAPAVRDALVRCIPDTRWRAGLLAGALAAAGLDPQQASAAEIAGALAAHASAQLPPAPQHLVIDPGTAAAPAAAWTPAAIDRVVLEAASLRDDVCVTLLLRGPFRADWQALAAAARAGGAAGLHLRTDLACDRSAAESLLTARADVISIDLLAEEPATYALLAGDDDLARYDRVRANLDLLLKSRPALPGLPIGSPWIVPRITRRDEVYEHIESFYDRAVLLAGWGVIDPLPAPVPGARIAPLPLPRLAAWRQAVSRLALGPDGRPIAEDSRAGDAFVGDALADEPITVPDAGLRAVWDRVLRQRLARLDASTGSPA